ncbi:O-antigen ligase family protein [Flavobacteriaceae bacterium]|nr:O-antigen ligase family protein [Flavobacteriaceae bacterium]
MKTFLNYFLLLSYLCIGFLGPFGAVDRIASQYLLLGIINISSIFYFVWEGLNEKYILQLKTNKPFLIFVLFFLWSLISIIYSIDKTQTLISLVRLFVIIATTASIILHVSKIEKLKNLFIFIFLPVITIQFLYPFEALLDIISKIGFFNFSMSNDLETFTPNKNITAAIIACHLPFVFILYSYVNSKKVYLIGLVSIIIFIGVVDIIFLSARASLLGLFGSLFFVYIICLVFKKKLSKKLHLFSLILILAAIFSNFYLGSANSASLNKRIASINLEDQSANQRMRYYKHGITHFSENPLIGIGLGNWKLKSIEYDKENITQYIVPYHLHNDFIQYGTELGIIGFLLYAGIFLNILVINIKRIKINSHLSISLIMSITILFFDSNLNFPHHRPIMMILFGFIIALTQYNKVNEIQN